MKENKHSFDNFCKFCNSKSYIHVHLPIPQYLVIAFLADSQQLEVACLSLHIPYSVGRTHTNVLWIYTNACECTHTHTDTHTHTHTHANLISIATTW